MRQEATNEPPQVWTSQLSVPFDKLSPQQFEQLCYQLIDEDPSFRSAIYQGARGKDLGRDIVAQKEIVDGNTEKWMFQCKRQKRLNHGLFCGEITQLCNTKVHCDVLVFMTSEDVTSSTVDIVLDFASVRGYDRVEFWGATKLSSLLSKNRHVLNQYFRAELFYIEQLQQYSRQLIDVAGKLQFQIEQERDERCKKEQVLRLLFLLVLLDFIAESTERFQGSIFKVAKDKKAWDQISKRTEEFIEEHSEDVKLFDSFPPVDISKTKADFMNLVKKEGLNLAFVLFEAIGARDEDAIKMSLLSSLLVERSGEASELQASLNWEGFWTLFRIYAVEDYRKAASRGWRTFLQKTREVCPSCKQRLQYNLFQGPLYVSRSGEYIQVGIAYLICYECKRILLQGLKIRRNIEILGNE